VFFAFLISLIYYLLFKIIQGQKGNIVIAVMIALMVIIASSIHWLARPHIFSLLLFIVWYYILDSYQYKGKDYLYLLPPLMLLWVNLHGGFFLGLFLCGVYFLSNFANVFLSDGLERGFHKAKAKSLFIILAVSSFFSLLNPNGLKNLLLPFELLSSKFIMDHIAEFQSPNFHNVGLVAFEVLLLFTLLVLAISRNKLNITEIALMMLFTNMALYSVRNIPLFGIVMAPILARQSEQALAGQKGKFIDFLRERDKNISSIDMSARGYIWLVVPAVIVFGLVMSGRLDYRFDEKIKPVAAVEFLKKEHIKGNMYNEYEFGDYIIYSAYPQYRVFIDGRADMYGVERMKEYYRVNQLKPGWEKILDKHNVNFIVFNTDSTLSRFLLEKNEWKLIYSDKVANIFVKDLPENRALIEKYKNVIPAVIKEDDDESL
ncbi:MAG: hypothetical protein OEW04_05615, partial [Nitrospirota bacterium]|nr:hypothetical protein [Nitrospirota bacterium]